MASLLFLMNPCPFCKSTRVEFVLSNRPCVVCRDCDAVGPGAKRISPGCDVEALKTEAVNLWNSALGRESATPVNGFPRKRKEPSENGTEWADWFRDLLPEETRLAASWRQEWGIAFDSLFDIDKRKPDEVEKVCRWARADDFWSNNFQSPAKLRKRNGDGILYFDVLLAAAKSKDRKPANPTLGGNGSSPVLRL